ncbi:MAG: hypothetical protein NG740_03315 [Omnitrophica bacterium]|nr:hypothetical protein [Candidatus Omnitrophota bacterium]
MLKKDIVEILALGLVVITIVGLPFAIILYDRYHVATHFPKNSQIINLTASAEPCVWTRDKIVGFNYWWKKFQFAKEIPIYDDGRPIFFRVKSADVLHSFAIPLYRIGPFDIKAGEVQAIELKTNKALRSTKYLCWQYCSECHPDLNGRLVVK